MRCAGRAAECGETRHLGGTVRHQRGGKPGQVAPGQIAARTRCWTSFPKIRCRRWRGFGRQLQRERDSGSDVFRFGLRGCDSPGRRYGQDGGGPAGRRLCRQHAGDRMGNAAGATGRRVPDLCDDGAAGRRGLRHAGLVFGNGAVGVRAAVGRGVSGSADTCGPSTAVVVLS